jgi:hypothetical protein
VDGYDAACCGIVQAALREEHAPAHQHPVNAAFEEELFALLKKHFPARFV